MATEKINEVEEAENVEELTEEQETEFTNGKGEE